MSQKQMEANRKNAGLSTGPKSGEGKERSSRNSLKHGLCANTLVLPGEDPKELEARLAAWTAELQPRTQLELFLVEDAVAASWRLERCRKVEAAVLTHRMLVAAEVEALERAEAIDRLAAGLADDPALVTRRLAADSDGCRWLLDRLGQLREALDARGWLEPSERDRLLHLCGHRLDEVFADPFVYDVVEAATCCGAVTDGSATAVQGLLGLPVPETEVARWEFHRRMGDLAEQVKATEPAAARATLAARIDTEVARLARRAEQLAGAEAVARRDAPLRAACDPTPEGQARLRYEETHRRAFRNALRDLERVQRLDHDVFTQTGSGSVEPASDAQSVPTLGPVVLDIPPAPAALAGPEQPVDAEVTATPADADSTGPTSSRKPDEGRSHPGLAREFRGVKDRAVPDARTAGEGVDGPADATAVAEFEQSCLDQDERRGYPVPDPVFRVSGERVPRPPGTLGVPGWYRKPGQGGRGR